MKQGSDHVTECHTLGENFGGPVPARRDRGPRAAVRHAVYSGEQMLEIHSKTAISCHDSGPSARRPGGSARSARHYSTMRLDMIPPRRDWPGHPSTAWRGCIESATSISADCSLSQHRVLSAEC